MKTPAGPWYAQGDGWLLTQEGWDPSRSIYFETIFTQSNGYFGVRAYHEEINPDFPSHREGYLAGIFAQIDQDAVTQRRTFPTGRMSPTIAAG